MDENRLPGGLNVTPAVYLERAETWARDLESREQRRTGGKLDVVRDMVARKVGVPAGTLRSLRKQRLKSINVAWYDRLRAGVIHELEAELRHVQHELAILRQTGADPRSPEVSALVAHEAAALTALGRPGDGGRP